MGFEHTSGGDPVRSLILLWRKNPKQSRSGLSIEKIIAAGIELADRDGLETLSMRRVAERLASGTMSLYTHVPSKVELVDLMLDTVLGELYTDDIPEGKTGRDWKDALRFIAGENWKLFERHPWILSLGQSRPALGPNVLRKYELELRPLDGIGLGDVEMDSCLALVLTHTEGTARGRFQALQVSRNSGMSDTEWWEKTAPVLESVLDSSRYPVSSRVGSAASLEYQAASDPVHSFRFGMERIIDGIEVLIRKNRETAGP